MLLTKQKAAITNLINKAVGEYVEGKDPKLEETLHREELNRHSAA